MDESDFISKTRLDILSALTTGDAAAQAVAGLYVADGSHVVYHVDSAEIRESFVEQMVEPAVNLSGL